MSRLASFLALAGVVLLLIPFSSAVAAHLPAFSLSPNPVELKAIQGGFDYELVTVTNNYRRPIVIQSPASFTDTRFFDTQAGTCWQNYGVLGKKIPGFSSCTIQVGFSATGPYNVTHVETMTVYLCTVWHKEAVGIVCDTLGDSQFITVEGVVEPPPLPDLIVQTITLGDGEATLHGYTVTVKNQGAGSADLAGANAPFTSVGVQGWYSVDTIIDQTDSPACGKAMTGTLAAGATTNVVVGCSFAPAAAGLYLLVHVDNTNSLAESNETNNVGFVQP